MFAVVGLGNPGGPYVGTRHNVGFAVADIFANDFMLARWQKKDRVLFSRGSLFGQDIIVLMPQAFMNLSGQAILPLLSFYKIEPSSLIVVHDDLDLAPGCLKIKFGGGDAGHKGVKDIVRHVGSSEFIRVRVGVGHPRDLNLVEHGVRHVTQDVSAWVLSVPQALDRERINEASLSASEAIKLIISSGLVVAQQKFNHQCS